MSTRIHSRLFALPQFVSAKTVAFFVSFRSEVHTEAMIKEALSLGKVVGVPLTELSAKRLTFYRIDDYSADLAPGTWGILEPKPDRARLIPLEEFELIVTPGVAFDLKGNRVGYGGGFYDALLKSLTRQTPSVALAFEVQLVKNIPVTQTHDHPVDILITEQRIIDCKDLRSQNR